MEERLSKYTADGRHKADTPVPLITRVRLHIFLILAVRNLLRFLTAWAFVIGVVIITLRVVLTVTVPVMLWITASMAPGLIWVAVVSWRATPKHSAVRALLDKLNSCGGLLMTAAEVPLGPWRQKMPSVAGPAIKWHGSRTISVFALSVGFVLVSFLLPQRFVNITLARPLEIGPDIARLAEQVEAMQEANIISDEQARRLKEQLEQLSRETSGYDPAKTLEAIDHLEDVLTKEAVKAASDELNRMQNLAKAESLAQGLDEGGDELPEELLSQAMAELGSVMQSLAAGDEALKNALSPDTLKACKTGRFSPEQLREILSALKEFKGDISQATDKLCKAGLIDPNALQVCNQLADANAAGLIAFLKENADKMGMSEAISAYCSSPGSGGVSRGRGDAPMTWADESSKEGAVFKERVLPPAAMQALRDSIKMGFSPVAPSVEQGIEKPVAGGVLDEAPAGSGEAFKQKIMPRHRSVVQRYFEREKQDSK
ncbi:MAG: hypothetical protein JW749_13005 [Sedimentisphaerales bacterium]|nr:hypothetical protein [Sedimentisphaerales bacterium]